MTIAMQPIYTQTVGSGGVANILFSSIPQTFTDLKLAITGRSSSASPSVYMLFNMDGASNYSNTTLRGNGTGTASVRLSSTFIRFDSAGDGSDATANTFNNIDVHIPNYTSANSKSFIFDSVAESNVATFSMANVLGAGLWRNSASISSIYVSFDGTLQQHSTFSLYGITKG